MGKITEIIEKMKKARTPGAKDLKPRKVSRGHGEEDYVHQSKGKKVRGGYMVSHDNVHEPIVTTNRFSKDGTYETHSLGGFDSKEEAQKVIDHHEGMNHHAYMAKIHSNISKFASKPETKEKYQKLADQHTEMAVKHEKKVNYGPSIKKEIDNFKEKSDKYIMGGGPRGGYKAQAKAEFKPHKSDSLLEKE